MKTQENSNQTTANGVTSTLRLDAIYSILVKIGGAHENMRESFISSHRDKKYPCKEWRFMGKLGYGGKYRIDTNTVDCYLEDETRIEPGLVEKINNALKGI